MKVKGLVSEVVSPCQMYEGGLRFLLLPVIGMPSNVMRDGNFIFCKRIVEDLTTRGHYCHVVLPYECKKSLVDVNPRVMYHWSNLPVLCYDIQMHGTDLAMLTELFSARIGKYLIDAVVTWSAPHIIQLAAGLSAHTQYGQLPIFFVEPGVDWFTTTKAYVDDWSRHSIGCLGAMYAKVVTLCERDRQIWMNKCAHYGMSAAQLVRVEQNLAVRSVHADLKVLKEYALKFKKHDQITLLWAARTNTQKHPERFLEVADTLYKAGKNIRVRYLTQTKAVDYTWQLNGEYLFHGREYVHLQEGATVEQFYEEASQSHVYMLLSDSEAYPVSFVEAVLLGNVALVVDAEWARMFLGDVLPEQFWVKNEEDAIQKAMWVVDHWAEAVVLQEPLRAELMNRNEFNRVAPYLEEQTRVYVSNGVESKYFAWMGYKELLTEIAGFFALEEPQTFHELIALLAAKSRAWKPDNMVRASTRRFPSNFDLHGLMRVAFGLKDTCEKRYPVYVRK